MLIPDRARQDPLADVLHVIAKTGPVPYLLAWSESASILEGTCGASMSLSR